MNEKNMREGTFIPCGDAFEKMNEIRDDGLEDVSDGRCADETPLEMDFDPYFQK